MEIVEELRIMAADLRALRIDQKNGMESTSGFSADAIAHLAEKAADAIDGKEANRPYPDGFNPGSMA